jgi:hypothetical protein
MDIGRPVSNPRQPYHRHFHERAHQASFNAKDPQSPSFVRAAKHEPDMFYVNRYMRLVEEELFG